MPGPDRKRRAQAVLDSPNVPVADKLKLIDAMSAEGIELSFSAPKSAVEAEGVKLKESPEPATSAAPATSAPRSGMGDLRVAESGPVRGNGMGDLRAAESEMVGKHGDDLVATGLAGDRNVNSLASPLPVRNIVRGKAIVSRARELIADKPEGGLASASGKVSLFKPPVFEGTGGVGTAHIHNEPTVEEAMRRFQQAAETSSGPEAAMYAQRVQELAEYGRKSPAYKEFADKQWMEVYDTFKRYGKPVQRVAFSGVDNGGGEYHSSNPVNDAMLGLNEFVHGSVIPALSGVDSGGFFGVGKQAAGVGNVDSEPMKDLRSRGIVGSVGDELAQIDEGSPGASLIGTVGSAAVPFSPVNKMVKAASKLPWFVEGTSLGRQVAKTSALWASQAGGYRVASEGVEAAGETARGEQTNFVDETMSALPMDLAVGSGLGALAGGLGYVGRSRQEALLTDPNVGDDVSNLKWADGDTRFGVTPVKMSERGDALVREAAKGRSVQEATIPTMPAEPVAARPHPVYQEPPRRVVPPLDGGDTVIDISGPFAGQPAPRLAAKGTPGAPALPASNPSSHPLAKLGDASDELARTGATTVGASAGKLQARDPDLPPNEVTVTDTTPAPKRLGAGAGEPHVPEPVSRPGNSMTVPVSSEDLALEKVAGPTIDLSKARAERTYQAIHEEAQRRGTVGLPSEKRSTKALTDEMHALWKERERMPMASSDKFRSAYASMLEPALEPTATAASAARGRGGYVLSLDEAEKAGVDVGELLTKNPGLANPNLSLSVVMKPREMTALELDEVMHSLDRQARWDARQSGGSDPAYRRLATAARQVRKQFGPQWEAMKERHHNLLDRVDDEQSVLGIRGLDPDSGALGQLQSATAALRKYREKGNAVSTNVLDGMLLERPELLQGVKDYVGVRSFNRLSPMRSGSYRKAIHGPHGMRLDPMFGVLGQWGMGPSAAPVVASQAAPSVEEAVKHIFGEGVRLSSEAIDTIGQLIRHVMGTDRDVNVNVNVGETGAEQ